jgi:hypothetical protein
VGINDYNPSMSRYSPEGLEKIRKANEARFIRDARAKFGDRFDYSLIQYTRQKVPVTIVCHKHGPFQQTPDKHLQSREGCPKCSMEGGGARKKVGTSRAGFLEAFRTKHGGRLELLTDYVKARDPIRCRCKIHGIEFLTTPDRLLHWKHGCPLCAREATTQSEMLAQEEFLRRASEKFGSQFDLSRVVYGGMYKKIAITCPLHGEFKTTPVSFLQNTHGCPKCGKLYVGHAENRIQRLEQGLTKPRPTTIAVMKIEAFGIKGFKVGITARSLLARYRESLREILFEATLDELDALKLERAIHAKYFKHRDTRIFLAGLRAGKRWAGDSEIYDLEVIPQIVDELDRTIAEISDKSIDYWNRQPNLAPPVLQIRKINKTAKHRIPKRPVIRLDTLETFPTVRAAAESVKASAGNVWTVCKGLRHAANGVRLAFVSDYEAGATPNPEQRRHGKNNPSARAVRCVDTGQTFDTISEASRVSGVHSGKIVAVCKGRRKRAGKYSWEYVDKGTN